MFQITAETCRAFTFAEVLIMAAMNLESVRCGSEGCVRANSAAAQSKYVSPRCSYRDSQGTAIVTGRTEEIMAHATVAFTDLGNRAGTGFANMSEFEDDQMHLERRNQL